jgi:hypothetical protein
MKYNLCAITQCIMIYNDITMKHNDIRMYLTDKNEIEWNLISIFFGASLSCFWFLQSYFFDNQYLWLFPLQFNQWFWNTSQKIVLSLNPKHSKGTWSIHTLLENSWVLTLASTNERDGFSLAHQKCQCLPMK